ncbi:MAG: hypothetical protein U0893_11390 [Chloroflexota bacterium]
MADHTSLTDRLDDENVARNAAIERAEAELAEVNARLLKQLRRDRPEMFDSNGELIEAEYRRVISERRIVRGKLTREMILQTERERRQTHVPRTVDAP